MEIACCVLRGLTSDERPCHCEEQGAQSTPGDEAIQGGAVTLDCFAIARNDGGVRGGPVIARSAATKQSREDNPLDCFAIARNDGGGNR
jgi:hypothetical protein